METAMGGVAFERQLAEEDGCQVSPIKESVGRARALVGQEAVGVLC